MACSFPADPPPPTAAAVPRAPASAPAALTRPTPPRALAGAVGATATAPTPARLAAAKHLAPHFMQSRLE
ncbi:uncharacterized protein STEHIDRAFT_162353 [Stereum hirsutum FP-91666 SS1]|uniref:uncharacterized protein n=1 Tax=Stereum hirsutum (strain FP-91666) TaxID=721885 RepID=UPI0004449448|nr:uncharacterized protein STEHIDRAFT_162353 [Stereum hirsutum FP-91666 SS1]EIM80573.1 hypothetical protein STEHIDRAFT_162353 [Stereum hirsutum FP-91666 SS1]